VDQGSHCALGLRAEGRIEAERIQPQGTPSAEVAVWGAGHQAHKRSVGPGHSPYRQTSPCAGPLMLTLPRTLRLTPLQFAEVCAANPDAVLELDADGQLIERSPTGGDTSVRNQTLGALLWLAVRRSGLPLKVFDSSGGFLLPDGSVRSPDARLVRLERRQALSEAERHGFPPLCPYLVVELASPSDRPADLELRMASWIENGASLGHPPSPSGFRCAARA
jgi:Uma2 family endonuclease